MDIKQITVTEETYQMAKTLLKLKSVLRNNIVEAATSILHYYEQQFIADVEAIELVTKSYLTLAKEFGFQPF